VLEERLVEVKRELQDALTVMAGEVDDKLANTSEQMAVLQASSVFRS
jgi:hypothetical protein